MDLTQWRASLGADLPPPGLAPPLAALWWDAKQSWGKAHACVADAHDADAALVHAYLHRKEGDAGNARYWYSRAGRAVCTDSLEREWLAIASALIGAT